jgi:hypothetical protein
MIKFFREIRKKLIEQGKTGNYLKYATGEIVLVVIGILNIKTRHLPSLEGIEGWVNP